jgi:hypothetical protein
MLGMLARAFFARLRVVAVLVAVAVLGAAGAAMALTGPGHRTVVTTVSDSKSTSDDRTASGEDAHSRGPKGGAGEAGTHGACVQAVAGDPAAVGGAHHNHGGAVATAAHACAGHGAARKHGRPAWAGKPDGAGGSDDNESPTPSG